MLILKITKQYPLQRQSNEWLLHLQFGSSGSGNRGISGLIVTGAMSFPGTFIKKLKF